MMWSYLGHMDFDYLLDSRFRGNDTKVSLLPGRGELLHSANLTVSTRPSPHNL